MAGIGLLAAWRGAAVDEQRRAARYEATEAPLALVDGTDLDVDLAGWRLESVDRGWGYDRVTITYSLPGGEGHGSAWVTLALHARRQAISCGTLACDELGALADGTPIRGRRFAGERGGYAEVWADVPGGRWELSTSVDGALGSEAATVLRSLEPVDADRFAAAT